MCRVHVYGESACVNTWWGGGRWVVNGRGGWSIASVAMGMDARVVVGSSPEAAAAEE